MKKFLLPLLALAALALPARAAIDLDAVTPDGFARAVAFTVDEYAGSSTLTDFPVLVRISESAISGFDYDDLYSPATGDDLCFVADDGTALAYDIDTWDPTGTSLVWVKLPEMTNGTQFAMFYRSSKSGKTICSDNPFAGYVGVWHMGETGDGEVTVADAGPNSLTAVAGSPSLAKTDGQIGGARQICQKRDRQDWATKVTATDKAISALNTLGQSFSVSFWARPIGSVDNNGIGWDGLIGRKSAGSTAAWEIQVTDNPKKVRFWTSQTSDSNFSVTGEIFPFVKDNWGKIDVVYTYTNTTATTPQQITAYWNGEKKHGPSAPSGNKKVEQGSFTLAFGGYTSASERPFYGDMDEVRVGTLIPSADWIKADYDQENSASFLSAGTVVEFVELPKPVAAFSLVDSGAAFAQFGGAISALGGEATAADVYYKIWPVGGSEPETWTLLESSLAAGDTFEGIVTNLTPQVVYTNLLKAVNNLATPYDSDIATIPFTTSGSGDAGTGGDAKRVGDSIVHTFTVDSELGDTWEFTPPAYATSVEALVVAGGGPGGYYGGAGGGAGGLVYNAALPVTGGATYTVKVGAGGVASSEATAYGTNGGDSLITSDSGATTNAIAIGGGAGGNGNLSNQTMARAGASGGSGGGSTDASYAAGTGTSGQGNAGGLGLTASDKNRLIGAGGGGAGGAGGSVSPAGTVSGGSGGDGIEYDISGVPLYYAGGGGGGGRDNKDGNSYGNPGSGGRGGGGKGGMFTVTGAETEIPTAGEANTGGGGGGSTVAGQYAGKNGGSGIVIIRYPIQGDGTTELEPAVALTGATYDAETSKVSFTYRVAWAGYGYQLADVGVVWGYAPNALTTTNIVATDKIGSGSGEITLPQVSRTVYLRAVAVNAAGLSGVSVEQEVFTLFNPAAPVGTITLSSAAVTNATFAVAVTDLGQGASGASVTVQVCASADFTGTVLSFPAANDLSAAGTVSVAATGLSASSTYYARAYVVNDDNVELTTDAVEFSTYAPGAPVGVAMEGDVGFTTLGARYRVTDFGAYASSATVRLEVSTQEDFSTLASVSAEEAVTLHWETPLSVSGLSPDTYYYRRVRIVNDWNVTTYVAVPYTSTRAVPFAAAGPSWAAGDGMVDISLAVSAVYDGVTCTAVLTYGGEEVGTQTFDAADTVTWSDVPALADGTVATIVVTATVDGTDFSRTFSAPVTAGAGATAITSVTPYCTYGDNALWMRPGDVAMLPDLYGGASYQVLNERFASVSGAALTALEPGIVGIRCVDASFSTNVMGVVILPDAVGSGSVYVFKESKRNNTYDWARSECWDKVENGARAASNSSYPQNADDIAILPFNNVGGDIYVRHRTDISIGGLYSGMIRPDASANLVLERYKDDTTKTVTFERTDGEPVQIVVCPNNDTSSYYSRIRLGGFTIDVVWASDAVIDCCSSETDYANGPRGFFDVKEMSSPNISTNTLQGVTLTFKGYPGYNNSLSSLYGFWKGTGTIVKEGMGGIAFQNDIGGLSGNIVLKGQKTPGGLSTPTTQFSIRGGGATNLAATVYGVRRAWRQRPAHVEQRRRPLRHELAGGRRAADDGGRQHLQRRVGLPRPGRARQGPLARRRQLVRRPRRQQDVGRERRGRQAARLPRRRRRHVLHLFPAPQQQHGRLPDQRRDGKRAAADRARNARDVRALALQGLDGDPGLQILRGGLGGPRHGRRRRLRVRDRPQGDPVDRRIRERRQLGQLRVRHVRRERPPRPGGARERADHRGLERGREPLRDQP